MAAPPTVQQLSASLTAQNLPTLSLTFLASILTPNSASQRLPPLPALTATAKHRLLSSDLTTPSLLSPTAFAFPADLSNVHVTSKVLPQDTFVQVLDIDDLSKSKWEQIEALENERKGETTKGREVIRIVSTPADGEESTVSTHGLSSAANTPTSKGPFKLLLQDWKGQTVYGFELKKVDKIAYPPVMSIGCKILLKRGCIVARGVVLLEPGSVAVLGGRIEVLDKVWRERRESVLRERVKKEKGEKEASVAG
jgi:RecQ-mediated genome instability protein 1